MKTPITEAIEKIKFAQKHIISNTQYAQGYDGGLSDCINVLTKLLPKEKEVIEKAVDETNQKWRSSQVEVILNGRQYFNETFTQK
jgi:hypothetical protein